MKAVLTLTTIVALKATSHLASSQRTDIPPVGSSDERLIVTTEIDYEATGPNYAAEKLLDVRERVHRAIAAISAKIVPGMVEEDAVEIGRAHV